MAWLPSHQELREHPKTRRCARRLGVGLPAMVGHLHLLWWWALDHAPTGDLSRFDAEDIAEAAMWDGDPETFHKALIDCGPGGGPGFLDGSGRLHDWDDYGGRYFKRQQAGRKAAAVRWQCDTNANASGTHEGPQRVANAEEKRGEESKKRTLSPPAAADGTLPYRPAFLEFYEEYPRKAKKAEAAKAYEKARKRVPDAALRSAAAAYATAYASSGEDPKFIPYPASWLNGGCWEDPLPERSRRPEPGKVIEL